MKFCGVYLLDLSKRNTRKDLDVLEVFGEPFSVLDVSFAFVLDCFSSLESLKLETATFNVSAFPI